MRSHDDPQNCSFFPFTYLTHLRRSFIPALGTFFNIVNAAPRARKGQIGDQTYAR